MACIKYTTDLKGKFLLLRHGETSFNKDPDENGRMINPIYVDCKLNENGINQAKAKQKEINELDIEIVYASPLYRAIQTAITVLETHKNKDKIKIVVHPKAGEILKNTNDYVLDINKTKQDFAKYNIDWSLFDEYAKTLKYEPTFFYFENLNNLESEEEKNKFYENAVKAYKEGEDPLRKCIAEIAKLGVERHKRFESLKHAAQRFNEMKASLLERHKDTLNDSTKKVLIIGHASYSRVITAIKPYDDDATYDHHKERYNMKNCEIISLYF